MFRHSFEELTKSVRQQIQKESGHLGYTYYNLAGFNIKLVAYKGKHKDLEGVLIAFNMTHAELRTDKGNIKIPIYNLARISTSGKPIIDYVYDITGRPLKEGARICFAESCGGQTPELRVGTVAGFTEMGNVRVTIEFSYGKALQKTREDILYGVNSTIIIPFDEGDAVAWMLAGMTRIEY